MDEKDWIATVKDFLSEQLSGINNNVLYVEDVGGVKYEFVLEFPDDIPTKTGISGSEIVDINKTLDNTIVNVQRVFPDGEVIIDYSFNAKGKGGDVQALENFNKILKEGKGMKGVLLEYYDTFPVETTLPTTLENDITIPNTPEGIDTPTNVVDDIKLSGTMGGNTTPTGVNIAYANVEDLEQFIQFDRKAEGNVERINEIKKTILDKGYLYDTGYEGGVVFGVTVDELGNVQIEEANHRLQALIDVAKETGQEIYVPINPILKSTSGGNKVQLTSSDNAYNSMKQLLTDMLEGNKNFDLDMTINEKLGEPGRKIVELESYTYPGGKPGTSTNQSNIKKFFNSIGLNTITYDELPNNNIYKTGVNTFIDTPTNVVDDYINALKQEAGKYNTFDEYEKAFSREYKRGIYYHLTDNPNFVVDLSKGATDAATGKMTPGSIMFTTDLDYWADTTWTDRPYVAILDLSDVDESQFTQVNRGQGNEFYLDNASKVKVKEVIPVDEALKQSELINQWGLDNLKNKEDLKNVIWDNRLDTPGASLGAAKLNDPLVFDSWIDNLGKTTTSFVDNLPLETIVKNRVKNLIGKKSAQAATPGGLMDAVDVWEFSVLGLMAAAVAYKEYDEIPTILKNKTIDMFNSMTYFYNIPPVPKEEYNLDYEFINKVVETGEKFMPTDIIIKKVGEVVKGAAETGTVTGFGYVPTTPEKTDTMEKTQRIQPGVQEEKMFEQAKPKKIKPTGGAGAKIL